jgi:hypothetical protein
MLNIKCGQNHTIPIAPLNEPKDVSLHQNMKEGILIPAIQVLSSYTRRFLQR